jgi:hypothetical protein
MEELRQHGTAAAHKESERAKESEKNNENNLHEKLTF